ncbi:unnamed protein product [Lathyrus sativus]|nr:unnamed protein product [Lathyrus sativus]
MIHQKSRVKWTLEGDLNTRFFHASLKSRIRNNSISTIKWGNRLIEDPTNIKVSAVQFFKEKFQSILVKRPKLDLHDVVKLSSVEKDMLEVDFMKKDMYEVVFECDGNKCTSADGYNFKFLKHCWEIVGSDVTNSVLEFFNTTSLPKAFVSSFIALVPKVDNPLCFDEFRPINLTGCILKVVSKLLSKRLN